MATSKTASTANPPDAAAGQQHANMAPPDAQRLDGNAGGGMLDPIFSFEMTMAMACCDGCGATNPLGAAMAYIHGMGTILRCPSCDTALMRLAHVRDRYYLDLRGLRVLQITDAVASA